MGECACVLRSENMFVRLFMGKQPKPLECTRTLKEREKKMMLFKARASKASRCFF